MVREMFDLMYQADGIGLAANQVDLPYRLFIINLQSDPQARDQEFTFINPVLTERHGSCEGEEGCLSLPGLYGQVRRPERVTLNAYTLGGQEVTLKLDDLFARAVQHEIDHLDGVLFIDHLTSTGQLAARPAIDEFVRRYEEQRERGELPDDATIARQLRELENLRT